MDMLGEAAAELTIDEIMAMMGTTMDELIDQVVTQEMIDEMAASMVAEGNFQVKDGKLHLSDSLETAIDETVYETYTLEGDVLTLVTPSETDETTDFLYPMTFNKVA